MYDFLLAPVLSFLFAQTIKFALKARHKKLKAKDFFAYSSMPSSHTATVVSLAIIILLKEGAASPLFAIMLVLSSVVITDAIGLRNYLGQQGKTLNVLVEDLKEDELIEKNAYPKLLEQIGHRPIEILAGGLLGAAISIIIWLI